MLDSKKAWISCHISHILPHPLKIFQPPSWHLIQGDRYVLRLIIANYFSFRIINLCFPRSETTLVSYTCISAMQTLQKTCLIWHRSLCKRYNSLIRSLRCFWGFCLRREGMWNMLGISILEHIDKLTRFFAQSLNAFARVDFDYDKEAKENNIFSKKDCFIGSFLWYTC